MKIQLLIILFISCLGVLSCGSESKVNQNSANSNVNSTPEISEYDRELKALKTVDFDYIFALKRKDSEAFTSEDKKLLRAKTYRANRRTLTKDDKVVFIGSNYKIADKDLEALKKKFDFKDYSKSEEEIEKQKKNGNENVENSNSGPANAEKDN